MVTPFYGRTPVVKWASRLPCPLEGTEFESERMWIYLLATFTICKMEYAAELPAKASESTAGEFRECCTRFALKIEGKNRGGEGMNPVTTDRSE